MKKGGKNMKRIASLLTALGLTFGGAGALPIGEELAEPVTAQAADKTAADYTYEITPMLSPFNTYFYVKTENPDPMSFRFVDKSSVYASDGSYGSLNINYDSWDEQMILYSDVEYENTDTGRVKGGYIFTGSSTDGGEVSLQYKKTITYSEYNQLKQAGESANIGTITETTGSSSGGNVGFKTYRIVGYYKWEDTSVKTTLPKLVNSIDYLIDTYSSKDKSFFENMDSVQSGLNSICLYSGSYVRGEVYRANKYWFLSNSPHIDQTFYIQEPYRRKDNKSLLASALYPYRWDSVSFPSAMGQIAKKLSPDADYKWNENSHWLIDVTLNGETKSYGGNGSGKGQGIDEDQIIKKYDFSNGAENSDLASVKALLGQYSKLEVTDDYPHYDDLTWDMVGETVGSAGAWVRLDAIYSIFGSSGTGYTFMHKLSNQAFPGYISNGWVDGRYINSYEIWEPGAKFEDHPTSDILMTNYTIPNVTYNRTYKGYDYDKKEYVYEYSDITVGSKNIVAPFNYNSTDKAWHLSRLIYKQGFSYDYLDDLEAMAEQGLIDAKLLDAFTLTEEQVKALNVDKFTNIAPASGYIYDATTDPGTPFKYISGDVNSDGAVSVKDATLLKQYLAKWQVSVNTSSADTNKDGEIGTKDLTLLCQALANWNVKMV